MHHKQNNDTDSPVLVAVSVTKNTETYLTFKGVCEKLSVSSSTGERWKKKGDFPKEITINGLPRFKDSDVEKMIAEQNFILPVEPIVANSKTLNQG